jgi:tetratricopeptide (TPR) repeat protein
MKSFCGSCVTGLLVLGATVPIPVVATTQAARSERVTFTKDIAPILFERCGTCHHPDGVAPFSLLTYADARRRASLIATVTKRRLMPPWKSEPGYGDFIGQPHLSAADIDVIQQWAAAGAPEGDQRDLPPPPHWIAGWQLGKPDLIASLPDAYVVPAEGADFSRTFVFALPVAAVRYVKGLEFHPNSSAVHHANIRIDRTPASRRLDEQDPAPGFDGLFPFSAVYPDGHFLGWTPGQVAPLLPKGLSWILDRGTDLVVEVHFVPTGKREVFNPAIGLFFGSEAPERTPAMLRLGREDIDIPAGQKDYVSTDSFVLPVDVEVEALQPHAHQRAREITGTATLPDGTAKPLILIKDWDFRWQHVYRYVTPFSLPKGTVLSMRYTFDNSRDNARNPRQPPREAFWGQRTSDEMGDLWIQMLTRNDDDLRVLMAAIRPKETAEEIIGREMMVRADPSSVPLRNDLALMYSEVGRPDEALVQLRIVVTLQPESAAAHYNLGASLMALGKLAEAVDQYRHALGLEPEYVLAQNGLGRALLRLGSTEEALGHFREAARLDPGNAEIRYNIGAVSLTQGRVSDAIEQLRQAVLLRPDLVPAISTLAWVLATAPAPALRNEGEALRSAERAAALTTRHDPAVLDVLAAAQAASGLFESAVTTCDEALALAPEAQLASAIRQRQQLYKRRQPYVSKSDLR